MRHHDEIHHVSKRVSAFTCMRVNKQKESNASKAEYETPQKKFIKSNPTNKLFIKKAQNQLKNKDMSVDRQESTDSAGPILFRNLVGVQFMSSLTHQLVENSKQDTDGCRDVMFELTKQHGARTFLSNRRSFIF